MHRRGRRDIRQKPKASLVMDGLHGVYDTHKRSLAKSITYRILIIILDFAILYLMTGRLDLSVGFTVVSNIYTSIAYYVHERLWARIGWGRAKRGVKSF